jgi:hypothetical protein
MMFVAILLGALTIACMFVLGALADRCGAGSRFLERSVSYDAARFATWASAHPDEAQRYAMPVLFPGNLVFMLLLGGFLGWGSAFCAQHIGRASAYAWAAGIVPALYVVADLTEDVLLARLLTNRAAISPATVGTAQQATKAKFFLLFLAFVQAIVLAAWAAIEG